MPNVFDQFDGGGAVAEAAPDNPFNRFDTVPDRAVAETNPFDQFDRKSASKQMAGAGGSWDAPAAELSAYKGPSIGAKALEHIKALASPITGPTEQQWIADATAALQSGNPEHAARFFDEKGKLKPLPGGVIDSVVRGVDQLQGMGYGLAMLVNDLTLGTGNEKDAALKAKVFNGELTESEAKKQFSVPSKIADWLYARYKANQKEIEENPAPIGSATNIGAGLESGPTTAPTKFRQLAQYVVESIGEQGPLILESMGTSLVGRKALQSFAEKKVAGLVEKEAAAKIAQAGLKGEAAGAILGSSAIESGSIYGDMAEQDRRGRKAAATALVASIPAGYLDAMEPINAMRRVRGESTGSMIEKFLEGHGRKTTGPVGRIGVAAMEGALTEMPTEYAQTAIEQAAVFSQTTSTPGEFFSKLFSPAAEAERREAAVKAGVAGAAFGGGAQAFSEWRGSIREQGEANHVPLATEAFLQSTAKTMGGEQNAQRQETQGQVPVATTGAKPTTPPVPEPLETLQAQLALTSDLKSTKAVTLVTPGSPMPENIPANLRTVETPHGTAIYNPAQASEVEVIAAGQQKDFDGTLLGFSRSDKPAGNTVLQTTLRGVPVLDEVIENTPEAIAKAKAAHAAAVPGGISVVRDAGEILKERQAAVPQGTLPASAAVAGTAPVPPSQESGGITSAPERAVESILSKLESNIYTLRDAANEIINDDTAPKELKDAAENVIAAVKENREQFGERSGLVEDAENALELVLERHAKRQPPDLAREAVSKAEVDVDLSPIQSARTKNEMYSAAGALLRTTNDAKQLLRIRQAIHQWAEPPGSGEKVAPVVYKGFVPGIGKIAGVHQYDLTEDVSPTLKKGMTVSESQLAKEGFAVPASEKVKETAPESPPVKTEPTLPNAKTPTEIKPATAVPLTPAKPGLGQPRKLAKPIALSPEDAKDIRFDAPGITRVSTPNKIVIQLRNLDSVPFREVMLDPTGDPIKDAAAVIARIHKEAAYSSVSIRESAGTLMDERGLGVTHYTDTPNGPAWVNVVDLIEAQGRYKPEILPSVPPAAPTQAEPGVGDRLKELIARRIQKSLDEARGQEILDTLDDEGKSPAQVTSEFWSETYPLLPSQTQKRFQNYIRNLTSFQPGDVVATRVISPGNVEHIVAKDWSEIWTDVPHKAEYLEGEERGLIALMEVANRNRDQLKPVKALPTSPTKAEPGVGVVDVVQEQSRRAALQSERERILADIDDWRSGARASIGRPSTGERHQLEMRENVKALEKRLAEINDELGITTTRTQVPSAQKPKGLTPMMAQYQRIKEQLPPDTLLMFRLGDFYEFFFDDAKTASGVLNVALTKRGDVAMAGVPYHAAESYIQKLTAAGHKVAIVDQSEPPKPGQLVERKVTEVRGADPRTMSDTELKAEVEVVDSTVRPHYAALESMGDEAFTREAKYTPEAQAIDDKIKPLASRLRVLESEIKRRENEARNKAMFEARDARVKAAPVVERKNGWEIVKEGVDYVLRHPETGEDAYRGKLSRVREVASESAPDLNRTSAPNETPPTKKPLNMAGETRPERARPEPTPEFAALHPNARAKFEAAWEANDVSAMSDLLHLGNKGLRAEFERRMGVKLPKTVKGTRDIVERYLNAAESSRIAESKNPEAKMQEQVTEVAKTEGVRPAKEVKSELIERLEKAMANAPDVDYSKHKVKNVEQWREIRPGKRKAYKVAETDLASVIANPDGWKVQKYQIDQWRQEANRAQAKSVVTIRIPGDGTFVVPNTKQAFQEILERARGLDTRSATTTRAKQINVPNDPGFQRFTEEEWQDPKIVGRLEALLRKTPETQAAQRGLYVEALRQARLMHEAPTAEPSSDVTSGALGESGMGGAKPGEPAKPELAQLTDALRTLAAAGGKSEPAKAFDLAAAKEKAKDTLKSTLAGLRAAGAYLKLRLEGKPVVTDWRRMLGDRHLALSESAANARRWAAAAIKAMPDPKLREAISNWIDMGGNRELLEQAARETKARYKAGYERALRLTPEEQTVAENIRNYFESRLQDAIDAGILEDGIENYIHRIYESESSWKKGVLAELRSGIFTGRPNFAKQRVFQYDFEAEKEGKHPIKDFVKRVAAYDLALNKAIADRQAVKAMMEMKMPDGRPMIDVGGGGKRIETPSGEVEATVINRSAKKIDEDDPQNNRGDYKAYDHPALRKWKWATNDAQGNPIFVQGDVLVHPQAMSRVKVLFDRSAVRAHPVGSAMLGLSSTVKQTMLDLSGFHQVQIALHGMEHLTFKPVKEIDFDNTDVRGLIRGGAVVGETSGRELFSEGLSGSSLTRHIPWVGKWIQAYQDYLFGDFIPRIKVAMGLHALERNRQRFPKLSQEQIYQMTADQMNAAFGELNWEMIGASKTAQDVMRLTLLAPDFLIARGKFVAQAATKYGGIPHVEDGKFVFGEQGRALVLGAVTMWILARLINKWLDDEYHFEAKNAFSVVYRGRSYGLRTVQGDLIHAVTEPGQFVNHRLNPTFGKPVLEFVTGRDYFGRKRSTGDRALDFAQTIIPISLRGAISGREQTIWESFANAFGFVVKRDSPSSDIAKLASEWKEKNKVHTAPGEFIYDADKDPYRRIRLAAERDDDNGVRSEIQKAINDGLKRTEIREHFARSAKVHFAGSKENEKKFVESLSADQKKLYEDAVKERARIKLTVDRVLGPYN